MWERSKGQQPIHLHGGTLPKSPPPFSDIPHVEPELFVKLEMHHNMAGLTLIPWDKKSGWFNFMYIKNRKQKIKKCFLAYLSIQSNNFNKH